VNEKILTDDNKDQLFGYTAAMDREIYVSLKNSEDKPLPDNEIWDTVAHEIVHAIFMTGQYNNCNTDEPLVEWTAKCMRQLIKQKIME
jgi:hypothetical protein